MGGENLATTLAWAQLDNAEFTGGPLLALLTIGTYVALVVAAATIAFQRRDIAGAS